MQNLRTKYEWSEWISLHHNTHKNEHNSHTQRKRRRESELLKAAHSPEGGKGERTVAVHRERNAAPLWSLCFRVFFVRATLSRTVILSLSPSLVASSFTSSLSIGGPKSSSLSYSLRKRSQFKNKGDWHITGCGTGWLIGIAIELEKQQQDVLLQSLCQSILSELRSDGELKGGDPVDGPCALQLVRAEHASHSTITSTRSDTWVECLSLSYHSLTKASLTTLSPLSIVSAV